MQVQLFLGSDSQDLILTRSWTPENPDTEIPEAVCDWSPDCLQRLAGGRPVFVDTEPGECLIPTMSGGDRLCGVLRILYGVEDSALYDPAQLAPIGNVLLLLERRDIDMEAREPATLDTMAAYQLLDRSGAAQQGCETVQGYLGGRSVAPDNFERLHLRRRSPKFRPKRAET